MVGLLTALVETVPDGAHFSGLLFSCFQLMWGEAVALGDEMTQLLLLRLACSMVKVDVEMRPEAQRLPSLLTGDGAQTASQGVQSAQSTQIAQEGERREGAALEFFFQMVQYAVRDAAGEVVSVLLEDGLELWGELMKCPAARYGERLHALFPSLLQVYSHSMKSFPAIVAIVDAYVRLGQLPFLQAFGPALAQLYDTLFAIVAPRDMTRLATSVHFLTLLYPQQSVAVVTPITRRLVTLLLERERTGSNGEWAHGREVTARLPESSYVACLLIVAQLLLSGEPRQRAVRIHLPGDGTQFAPIVHMRPSKRRVLLRSALFASAQLRFCGRRRGGLCAQKPLRAVHAAVHCARASGAALFAGTSGGLHCERAAGSGGGRGKDAPPLPRVLAREHRNRLEGLFEALHCGSERSGVLEVLHPSRYNWSHQR